MKVYIIETGEYSQRGVWGVADSVEAAVEHIKAAYPAPYIVSWRELQHEVWGEGKYEEWRLVGDFSAVAGKSTWHTASYDISDVELLTLPMNPKPTR